MGKKLVIVGGVAGGATAAARARRLSEDAEIIMIDRGHEVSWANCGLPYYIGGEITDREKLLVQRKAGLAQRFNLDIRTRQEVIAVDRERQAVRVRNLDSGEEYDERYDALLLSPGASPIRPPIDGIDHPSIYTLRNLEDMDQIKAAADRAQTAMVVGGGFIGLEMAENLKRLGLDVALIEASDHVMPPLDAEVANRIHQELTANDVQLYLSDAVEQFKSFDQQVSAKLKSGATVTADCVVLSIGVRPETGFLKESGLEFNQRGALVVDEHMRTNDPNIYAVGDAVQVRDPVLGGETMIPLAGPANRQALLAVNTIFGRESTYRGAQGTSILRIFDLAVASTGRAEKVLQQQNVPYQKIYVHRAQHVGYYPGATQMMIKLLFTPDDGHILGAQIIGGEGVDKRIDVIATAMYSGLTVKDLEALELAYSPQFGAAKDAINIAGYVATNALTGDERFVYAEDVAAQRDDWTILDVRSPEEYEAGAIDGALNLPIDELRDRLSEVPQGKPIATYCGVGQRAYYATRILRQNGIDPSNLAGGITTWKLVQYQPPKPRPLSGAKARKETDVLNTNESAGVRGDAALQTQAASGSAAAMAGAADESPTEVTQTLDLRGLQCPGPLASLTQAAKQHAPGTTVRALASDIGFATDVDAWCRRGGHQLLHVERENGTIAADIKLAAQGTTKAATADNESADVASSKTMVVFSGDLDRVMGSFVIANAAADMGDKVTMFFTFWGLNALRKPEGAPVTKDFMSRMFGWMMPRGATKLKLSQMNMGGMGTAMMKGVMKRKNVDDLPTMIANAQRKGVRMVACSMSLDVMGLKPEELIDGVEIAGAAGYLAQASESRVNLFI